MNPDQRVSSAFRVQFLNRTLSGRDGSALQLVIKPPSANPLVVIPVQLEPAVLPGYTIPPLGNPTRNRPYLISAVTDGLDDGRAFSFEASSYATSSAGCLASSRLEIRASCDFPTCPPYISAPHQKQDTFTDFFSNYQRNERT